MRRALAFGLVALAFNVTQPFVLVGLPLAALLVAVGPRKASTALFVGAIVALCFLGERSGLWWFERGWPLILGGGFVWVMAWRPDWSFSAQALSALGVAVAAASLVFLASPAAWLDVDASMAMQARQAASTMLTLLGDSADDTARSLMSKVSGVQVAVFPALLGVSSIGALGVAVSIRDWLAGDASRQYGRLRSFSFNDHLVWIWLAGLILILAPMGEIAGRIGSNAVFFMGALYVVRGMAVALTVVGSISVLAGVIGAVVAILIYPVLALLLAVMLIVGLSDTWLNVRERIRARREDVL
jgi:hypothetical protein